MTPLTNIAQPVQALEFNMQDSNAIDDSSFELRTATYVKVADLATLNHLDLEKFKSATEQKSLELGDNVSLSLSSEPSEKRGVRGISSAKYQKRILPVSHGFNLCLLVGKIDVVVQKTRVDMSQVMLAECEVGDESGIISLRCRNEQIPLLQELSKSQGAVILRNCSIELYQGKYIRLAVNKWGKISPYPDSVQSTPNPPKDMNRNLNLSIVDTTIFSLENLFQSQEKSSPTPVEGSENDENLKWKSTKSHKGKRGGRGYHTYTSGSTNPSHPVYPQFYTSHMFPYFPYSHGEGGNQHDHHAMIAYQHQYNMQYQMGNMIFHQEQQVNHSNMPMYPDVARNSSNAGAQEDQLFSSGFSNYSFSPRVGGFEYQSPSSISPIARMDASRVSFSESDDYSIRQQESPMMNPNAPSFSFQHNMPYFTLSQIQQNNFCKKDAVKRDSKAENTFSDCDYNHESVKKASTFN